MWVGEWVCVGEVFASPCRHAGDRAPAFAAARARPQPSLHQGHTISANERRYVEPLTDGLFLMPPSDVHLETVGLAAISRFA